MLGLGLQITLNTSGFVTRNNNLNYYYEDQLWEEGQLLNEKYHIIWKSNDYYEDQKWNTNELLYQNWNIIWN